MNLQGSIEQNGLQVISKYLLKGKHISNTLETITPTTMLVNGENDERNEIFFCYMVKESSENMVKNVACNNFFPTWVFLF